MGLNFSDFQDIELLIGIQFYCIRTQNKRKKIYLNIRLSLKYPRILLV